MEEAMDELSLLVTGIYGSWTSLVGRHVVGRDVDIPSHNAHSHIDRGLSHLRTRGLEATVV